MAGIQMFVDEGLGHSSYLVDLGDGTAAILDPPRFPSRAPVGSGGSGDGSRAGRSTPIPTPTT